MASTTIDTLRAAVRPPGEPDRAPLMADAQWFGHLRRLNRDPLGLLMDAFMRHGDVARLQLGPLPTHLVTGPAQITEVLITQRDLFSKQTRGFAMLRPILGQGLLTAEGELWRRQRRTIQPGFGRRRIAGFAPLMVEATRDAVTSWVLDEPIDIADAMTELTLQIAARTLFGTDVGSEADRVGHAVSVLMEGVIQRINRPEFMDHLPLRSNRRREEQTAELQSIVDGIIDRRRRGETEGDDLLQMLIDARDEHSGAAMPPDQLRDEVMTLFLAGHETTANALAWTLALLSLHPAVSHRVEAEVDGVLGGRAVTPGDLAALPVTLAVIKESLRLYPPAWSLSRRAEAATSLGAYRVYKGDLIIISPYVAHRNPAEWDNPEAFDPDRFLDGRAPSESSTAYLPFGAGPRHCIGKHFALQEMHMVVATIVQHLRFALVPGCPLVPEPLITLRPRHGVMMTATRRSGDR